MDLAELRWTVTSMMPGIRADLEKLVRLPSVSLPGFPRKPVRETATAVTELLKASGFANARKVEISGGNPMVFGEMPSRGAAPTVLLYSHYDVQPPGPEETWESPPFEPTERNGRLYGRGAADDKSGIVMHAAAVRALGGKPPVTIKVVIEGEEETDSHLDNYVLDNPEPFQADLIVVGDTGNWKVGEPTLTTSLRGLAVCNVEVKTLKGPVHSGMFGGPAPDALMVLIRLLAGLYDEAGNVAVEGIGSSGQWDGLDFPEEVYRDTAGVLSGVPLIGSGSVSDRLWARPSVTVLGLDAPAVEGAANALIPEARAVVSMRVPPGMDSEKARALLAAYLRSTAPWGVEVSVTEGQAGPAFMAATDGPGYRAAQRAMNDAFGRKSVLMGQGGSVPLVSNLAKIAPQAEIILWGVEDGVSAIHSANESVDLSELEHCVLAEALLLQYLAEPPA
jgi:acetylornithine deacetylase/succinyl-diaminopimelate desuccinylase-like protein